MDLLTQLKADYPEFNFKASSRFLFRPPKTIHVGPDQPNFHLLLLHELGHAINKHRNFNQDIIRLKLESEAWETAKKLCAHYRLPYDQDFAEDQLDSYRNWLHQKSTCKHCGSTRFQTPDQIYHCPLCEC